MQRSLFLSANLLYFLVGCLCLCGLAGCQNPPPPDLVRVGLSAAPLKLDPRFTTDASGARVNRLLYERLVDFDEGFKPIPALARWEGLSPTHYRFYLRAQRRQFHDGQRLTAQDVAATYQFILDKSNGSPHRATLQIIEKIQVLDDDTLDFYLNKADLLFPGYLVIGIVPAAMATGKIGETPIGSGAFRLRAGEKNSELLLERVSDGLRVAFLEVKDPTVQGLKLLQRELDIAPLGLDAPELVKWLRHQPTLQVHNRTGNIITYLGFNLEDAATGDKRVRQAIAHAIDRPALIRYLLGESAQLASSVLPPHHWAAKNDLPAIAYDPAKARALLAEVGYSAQNPLHLSYKTSTNPQRLRIATAIQQQLATVNIQVDIRSYDWGTFYGDIKAGKFQIFSLSWTGIKSPDIFRYAFHSQSIPPVAANRGRFRHAQVDALIEAAEQAPTRDIQVAHYQALQTLLLTELPYVPLWYEDFVVVTNQRVQGYQLNADGNFDSLREVTIK